MKSFGEFKERAAIEEALAPELQEVIKHIDQAIKAAESAGATGAIAALENARQEIITGA